MPGLGEISWPKVMDALYSIGYDFVISVEHGGPSSIWEENEAEIKKGFLIARNALAPLIA
jgi:sugar phosphate isomerase/epimerase